MIPLPSSKSEPGDPGSMEYRRSTLYHVLWASIVWSILLYWALKHQVNIAHMEAVQHDAAEWVVSDDGTTVFRWKTDPTAKSISFWYFKPW